MARGGWRRREAAGGTLRAGGADGDMCGARRGEDHGRAGGARVAGRKQIRAGEDGLA